MNIEQIHLDERGTAWIGDTGIKVIEVIFDHIQGQTPERICAEHPHLSLAQVRAAVAYYGEHTPEIDALMQQSQKRYITEYAKPENQDWRERRRRRAAAMPLHSKEEVAA